MSFVGAATYCGPVMAARRDADGIHTVLVGEIAEEFDGEDRIQAFGAAPI